MKKLLITISLLLSLNSFATNNSGENNWVFATNGTSLIWELHIIKNDGMNSHVKYRCSNLSVCWDTYDLVRYRSNNLDFANKVWLERLSAKVYLLK